MKGCIIFVTIFISISYVKSTYNTYCPPITGLPSKVPRCRLDLLRQPRHYNQKPNNNNGRCSLPYNGPNCPITTPEYNKNFVICFYEEAFGLGRFTSACRKYIDPIKYIQHNPNVGDGVQAFLDFVGPDSPTPLGPLDIHRVAADGDLVWIHIRDMSTTPNTATVDIFRMECGKIVEHWDVIQPIVGPFNNSHPFF